MARIENKKIISGLIGELVFRNLRNKQVIQSRPKDIKQTVATKSAATEFGQCSTWAKQLRLGLNAFLLDGFDNKMYQRLTAQFYNAIKNNLNVPKGQRNPLNSTMNELVGFEFNNNSPFTKHFTPQLQVALNSQNQLTITLPAFDPKTEVLFPKKCSQVSLLLYVFATTFKPSESFAEEHFILNIDQNIPINNTQTWTSAPLPQNHLVLLSTKLMYYNTNAITGKNFLNTKLLNPAAIDFVGHTQNT